MIDEKINLLGHHLLNLRNYYQSKKHESNEMFLFIQRRAYKKYNEVMQDHIFSIFDKIIDNKGLKIKLIAGKPDIICNKCTKRNEDCFTNSMLINYT